MANSVFSVSRLNGRKLIAGGGLIVGSLALVASKVTYPADRSGVGEGPAATLATVQQHPEATLITTLLFLLSAAVFLLSAVGIAGALPRGRGATLTFAGACVLGLGAMGNAMQTVVQLTVRALASPDVDQAQVLIVMQHFGPYFIVIAPFLNAFLVGMLILFGGLWRARLVPAWPLALAVAGVAILLSPLAVGGVLGSVLAAAAFVWCGIGVLRAPEDGTVESGASQARLQPALQS